MAAECSLGNPNCCSSVENVVSSVLNRVALTNRKRMHDIAAFTDFKSFLLVVNDDFSFASCKIQQTNDVNLNIYVTVIGLKKKKKKK